MKRLDDLIEEFSNYLERDFSVDQKGLCTFSIDGQVKLTIEMKEEEVVVSAPIGEVPPGPYREKVLREALIANRLESRVGILCFDPKEHMLALFDRFPIELMTAEKLEKMLGQMTEVVKFWKDALRSGNLRS